MAAAPREGGRIPDEAPDRDGGLWTGLWGPEMLSLLEADRMGGLLWGILTVGLWTRTKGVLGREAVGEAEEEEGLMLAIVERAFFSWAVGSGAATSAPEAELRSGMNTHTYRETEGERDREREGGRERERECVRKSPDSDVSRGGGTFLWVLPPMEEGGLATPPLSMAVFSSLMCLWSCGSRESNTLCARDGSFWL